MSPDAPGSTPPDAAPANAPPLKRTALYDAHLAAGAKMVPFAGYEMPVQYAAGVLKEHLWTREKAGLFDVSHMGQASLVAEDGEHATVARAFEALVPADLLALAPGQQRYTQLLSDSGGIVDDLMVARPADPNLGGWLNIVVNASRKDIDYRHIAARLPRGVRLETGFGYSGLIALQGPASAAVMARVCPEAVALPFMTTTEARLFGKRVQVTRSGYTGEDGFEIAVGRSDAATIWSQFLEDGNVAPIGLGARDSLRLEAGLCLYGHDIDETTSPLEAGLTWSIQKRRRAEGGFPGVDRMAREFIEGPARRRVGILPDGRAPAREGTEIRAPGGPVIGTVTSGGFGPSLNAPIAMGYVKAAHAAIGTPLELVVRGKPLAAKVAKMPFVPHRYHKSAV